MLCKTYAIYQQLQSVSMGSIFRHKTKLTLNIWQHYTEVLYLYMATVVDFTDILNDIILFLYIIALLCIICCCNMMYITLSAIKLILFYLIKLSGKGKQANHHLKETSLFR